MKECNFCGSKLQDYDLYHSCNKIAEVLIPSHNNIISPQPQTLLTTKHKANELADALVNMDYTPLKAECATLLRTIPALEDEIEALKAENRVLRKGELWLGMVYNNRGNGIAPMYLENFMRFCEENGFTEESGYKLFKAQG